MKEKDIVWKKQRDRNFLSVNREFFENAEDIILDKDKLALFGDISIEKNKLEYDEETGNLWMELTVKPPNDEIDEKMIKLGVNIPLDLDTVLSIIKRYIKEVNKVRTVIEGLK